MADSDRVSNEPDSKQQATSVVSGTRTKSEESEFLPDFKDQVRDVNPTTAVRSSRNSNDNRVSSPNTHGGSNTDRHDQQVLEPQVPFASQVRLVPEEEVGVSRGATDPPQEHRRLFRSSWRWVGILVATILIAVVVGGICGTGACSPKTTEENAFGGAPETLSPKSAPTADDNTTGAPATLSPTTMNMLRKLFVVTSNDRLLMRDPVSYNIAWTDIGHAVSVVAMTALGDKLYCVTNYGRLFMRDPVPYDTAWIDIGHAENVVAMAALGDKLYCVTSDDRLFMRDPFTYDTAWIDIGHAENVVAMAALGDKLYCVTSYPKLLTRDPVPYDTAWIDIGHAPPGVIGMAVGEIQ